MGADQLKRLETNIPTKGLTDEDMDYEIQHDVAEVMKDLANDPELDPKTINRRTLRKSGVDPKAIDEIMKLKTIYDEVDDGKAVDIPKIRQELDEVINDLEENAVAEE